jgi:hypothetical protein
MTARAVAIWFQALAVALAAVALPACSSHRDILPSNASAAAEYSQGGAEAKIHINYSHPGDFLASMSVTKYSSAEIVKTLNTKDGVASVVRFSGGILVWEFAVEKSMLTGVPLIGHEERRYSQPRSSMVTCRTISPNRCRRRVRPSR